MNLTPQSRRVGFRFGPSTFSELTSVAFLLGTSAISARMRAKARMARWLSLDEPIVLSQIILGVIVLEQIVLEQIALEQIVDPRDDLSEQGILFLLHSSATIFGQRIQLSPSPNGTRRQP